MRVPQQMKAVLLTGFGGLDRLEYREDIPVPVPAQGEVLLRVGATGMNNTDIWTRVGAYGGSLDDQQQTGWRGGGFEFPRIQGADIVGRVVALGPGVAGERLGERVLVNPALYVGEGEQALYRSELIGSERDGGYAEYTTVPAENAIPIESQHSDAELATFMVSYLTAEHMLSRGRVVAGERVLVTGASGGVGSALVQLARRRGAQVIAVAGAGKESAVKAIGADAVITRGREPGPALAELGLSTLEVVLDVVAGPQAPQLLAALAAGGRFVTAGAIAGAVTEIDWRTVYLKHLDIFGSTMGTMQEAHDLVRYIVAGEIRPLLAGTYPLSALVQAQQDFQKKAFVGKLVITP